MSTKGKGAPGLGVGAKQTSVETKKRAVQSLTSQLAAAYAKKRDFDGKKKKSNAAPDSDDDGDSSSDYTSSEEESSSGEET